MNPKKQDKRYLAKISICKCEKCGNLHPELKELSAIIVLIKKSWQDGYLEGYKQGKEDGSAGV